MPSSVAATVYRAGASCRIKSQDFVTPNHQFHVNLGLEELGKANTTTQLKNNAIVGVWPNLPQPSSHDQRRVCLRLYNVTRRGVLSGIESGNVGPWRKEIKKESTMKQLILSMALAVAAPFAWAQVSETTTTTTTTEGNGTITEYTPGSTIILKETSGPRTYHFGKTVTYVTRSGKTLDEDTVRTRVKVGIPVRVHYVGTGDNLMVDRVILDED